MKGEKKRKRNVLRRTFEEYITGFAKNYSHTSAQSPSNYFYFSVGQYRELRIVNPKNKRLSFKKHFYGSTGKNDNVPINLPHSLCCLSHGRQRAEHNLFLTLRQEQGNIPDKGWRTISRGRSAAHPALGFAS